jgi:hypothetical protein
MVDRRLSYLGTAIATEEVAETVRHLQWELDPS